MMEPVNQSININVFSWRHMSWKSESEVPMDATHEIKKIRTEDRWRRLGSEIL